MSCPSANLFYSHSNFLAQTAEANVSNAVCRLALVQEKASSRTKRECAQSITNIESQIDKYAGLVLQAARNRFQYEVGNSVALALSSKAISGDGSDGCSSGVLQMAAAVSKLKAAVSKFKPNDGKSAMFQIIPVARAEKVLGKTCIQTRLGVVERTKKVMQTLADSVDILATIADKKPFDITAAPLADFVSFVDRLSDGAASDTMLEFSDLGAAKCLSSAAKSAVCQRIGKAVQDAKLTTAIKTFVGPTEMKPAHVKDAALLPDDIKVAFLLANFFTVPCGDSVKTVGQTIQLASSNIDAVDVLLAANSMPYVKNVVVFAKVVTDAAASVTMKTCMARLTEWRQKMDALQLQKKAEAAEAPKKGNQSQNAQDVPPTKPQYRQSHIGDIISALQQVNSS